MAQEGNDDVFIYIMPHKIQKQRLRDMQSSMKKKKLRISSTPDNASYFVTEYDSLQQVKEQLRKDGLVCPEKASFVTTRWLVACLKVSKIVPVEEDHKLRQEAISQTVIQPTSNTLELAEWACQRGVNVLNKNKKFSDALEVLQEYAELRDSNQDYSRALAFRRASCVLKSFPIEVTDTHQLDGIKDIGNHARNVITDIIDQGHSTEEEDIKNSEWFLKMKIFTGVFGVGPSTAKKWIDKGWTNIQDVVKDGGYGSDWRISWGFAFYSDLNTPVSLCEASAFLDIVKEEAGKLLPGVIVSLVGGFRRGKKSGHDVDILLSHPDEGRELGLLPKLLNVLDKRQFILVGHSEKNSYRPEILYQDFKLSMRGQLDHFEKWLGICRFPNSLQTSAPQDNIANSSSSSQGQQIGPSHHEHRESVPTREERVLGECSKQSIVPGNESLDESLDDDSFEPLLKKSRMEANFTNQPMKLSEMARDWTARRVDLIVSSYSQYYYALVGWTGSKHFNRDARLYAQKVLGLKLTSHGLYDSKKQMSLPAKSEEEVFHHLEIPYRKPQERNC